MNKKYCYCFFIASSISSLNIKTAYKYKQLEQLSEKYNAEMCYDVMNGHSKKYSNFNRLIEEKATIILHSIDCLGAKSELTEMYEKIIDNKICLLIDTGGKYASYDFSTCDNSNMKLFSEDKLKDILDKMKNDFFCFIPSPIKKQVSNELITLYWEVENGNITQASAIETLGISKNTFRSLCFQYETTDEYLKELNNQLKINHIDEKVKQLGNIPSHIDELYQKTKDGNFISIYAEMCEKYDDFKVNPIDAKRYMIKYARKQKNAKIVDIQKKRYHKKKEKEQSK